MTKLDYYGEGPQSSRQALALYSERDIHVGVGVSIPLAWWLNVGAKAEGLWPAIGPASTSTIPSVADDYSGVDVYKRQTQTRLTLSSVLVMTAIVAIISILDLG